jgi:peptidoglycan/xylan/chitin deacetylase (PgdA/CDA1 family)
LPTLPTNISPVPTLISHGDRARPYIALTFDACQSADSPAGYDEAIINILTQTRTPATLFLGGLWMQRHSAQTRVLAANPLFELGNHAWSHPNFSHLSPEEMSTEILRTQQLMVTLTGRRPALFRFPFGLHTEEALAVLGQHGLQAIQWDVLTGDPDPRVSAGAMVKEVAAQARNGSIVIMHLNTGGRHTAEALPAIIEQLREQGYTLVTVSQLLALAPPPASP